MSSFVARHRLALIITAGIGAIALAGALAVFKPWLLFVDTTVNDALPVPSSVGSAPAPADGGGDSADDGGASAQETGPVLVAGGTFISHEHETTGTTSIYRLPDGSHQLTLENLATSNGPDVHVWLSAGPVIEGRDGWFTAGDHDHLDIAPIKGNRGNQVYDLPAGTDPSQWSAVVLWCEDFSVSFGAAELSPS